MKKIGLFFIAAAMAIIFVFSGYGQNNIRPQQKKEDPAVQKWTEKDGIINFSVTSDSTDGRRWIIRLKNKGFLVNEYAKSILLSKDFKPTKNITYEISVFRGTFFKSKSDRTTEKIRDYAAKHGLSAPNAEIGCLIREKFSDEELANMGLIWIVVMHNPLKDCDDYPLLLSVGCDDSGSFLSANFGGAGSNWYCNVGFAFIKPQVQTFSPLILSII